MSKIQNLYAMIDCSRNGVMRPEAVKKLIDQLSALGYKGLMLYTEDTFEVNGEARFGYFRGRYGKDDLKELDRYAAERGLELIPCIQTLAHLNGIFHWPEYCAINDCNDILLADDERTYCLIENIFSTLAECFTSRTVNIGMDEAHMFGLGRYLDLKGPCDRTQLFMRHLKRVVEIAEKYGFVPLMWSDMFVRLCAEGNYYATDAVISEEVKNAIPRSVSLILWDYYHQNSEDSEKLIKVHKQFNNETWFASGAWCWPGLVPHNRFSFSVIRAAVDACERQGVRNLLITLWGDNGSEVSRFSVLPALTYAAELVRGNRDESRIREVFYEKFHERWEDFLWLDFPAIDGAFLPETNNPPNPSKYLLFNDCFMGIFDNLADKAFAQRYRGYAAKLKRLAARSAYASVFLYESTLADALSIKACLGVRTREAYRAKDTMMLAAVISDYAKLIGKLEKVYKAYRRMWFEENRAQGFEVADIRFGGLIRRVRCCMERLKLYAEGKTDCIEELEEDVMPAYFCGKETGIYNSIWSQQVTVNNL